MPLITNIKTLFSKAGQYTGNLILRGLIRLALVFPYKTRVEGMGWLVSHVLAPLAGFDKRVRENLKRTMPELSEAEIKRLCRAVPNNSGRTIIEFYSGDEFVQRAQDAPITGPGYAAFQQARAKGRAVIIVTGHFGNYEAGRASLKKNGHTFGALYRKMANPYFNAHYVRNMAALGTPLFEQGRRGMMELVRHLKGGNIVAILTDMHVQGGANLTFFGQPAVTSLVTAELALKYDAMLIPVYAIRQPNGLDFEISMQSPIAHTDAETMTQAVNDNLEMMVRAHMDQWFWIHRRWKPYNPPA
jgi:KDO2-lipid IV(A) lauroyltransferase